MNSFFKHHKLIGFLLILTLLFFNVYQMNTQADSVSMYGIVHHTDSVLQSPDLTMPAEQLCNESSLRMVSQGALLRQTPSRISNRAVRSLCFLFFLLELLFGIVPAVFARDFFIYNKVTSSSHTILRYLHRKDGKK